MLGRPVISTKSKKLSRAVLAVGLWMVAVELGVRATQNAFDSSAFSLDFRQLRVAGDSLWHGLSVYADRAFLLPPTAAGAVLPLSLGPYDQAAHAWIALETVAVGFAVVIATTPAPRRYRVFVMPVAIAFVFKADLLT